LNILLIINLQNQFQNKKKQTQLCYKPTSLPLNSTFLSFSFLSHPFPNTFLSLSLSHSSLFKLSLTHKEANKQSKKEKHTNYIFEKRGEKYKNNILKPPNKTQQQKNNLTTTKQNQINYNNFCCLFVGFVMIFSPFSLNCVFSFVIFVWFGLFIVVIWLV